MTQKPLSPFFIGAMAIPFWSLTPLFIVLIGDVPALFLMGFRFLVSGIILSFAAFMRGEGFYSQFRQPAGVWILSAVGILISQVIYIFALQNAPTAEANFINYLWPVMLILLTGLLGGEKLSRAQIAGVVLGLAGFSVLMFGQNAIIWRADYAVGYTAAFFAGLLWAFYSAGMRKYFADRPSSVQGAPFLIYAIICFALHSATATAPVVITAQIWPELLAFGIIPVAYVFWEYGIKRGALPNLVLLSYFIPLLSAIWIVLCTDAQSSPALWIGGALIVLAPIVGSIKNWPKGFGRKFLPQSP